MQKPWTLLLAVPSVGHVTTSDVWDEQTAATYDEDMAAEFAPEVVDPAVDCLDRLAEGEPVLEFAIGTGRIGVPPARRGAAVTGIELSAPMVAQLRRKVDHHMLPVALGDMARTTVAGRFSLVYLVFNSISNLRTQAEQVECFRNAARHLRPGGRFVVKLWVPGIQGLAPGSHAVARQVRDGYAAFDTYDISTQECTSQTFTRMADGSTRHDMGRFRYLWPAECDLMATLAGLTLQARMSDWQRGSFSASSSKHISVWRKDEER